MITDTEELEYSSPPNNNPPRILFGSRLTWDKSKEPKFTELDYKGSDILIRAAGKLKNNGYNFELHLFRKGAHIEETEALAKSVGLESTIFWHDEVNQSEILEYYKQADIIVDNLESLGVGMVTVDSMAIGRPVIAKVENMKHFGILEHFPVCSAQTEEDVCNWLERLLIDSNLRESIGKNSRSFAEEYFSANKIAQIILSRLGDENVLKSGALGALIGGNMIDPQDRFGFGKNWNDFINNQFNKERVEVSKQNLLSSLKRDSLAGLAFLDIGCGSGLHSLAAILSGADRVVSFDYDPDSVKTAMMLRERYAADANWEILQGSALDTTFLESLGKFDIVYSWGVLHHTGHMWQAIENSAIPLADNGVHFIALYSHTVYQNGTLSGSPSPEKWLEIKQRYNKSSDFMKRIMEYKHVWNTFIKPPLFRPFQIFNNYKNFKECQREYIKSRGMEIWTDVRDWLGGWPMEFVNEFDLQRFMADKMGLRLVEMYCGEGNTEFVSVPHSAQNWWADIESRRSKFPLNGPFEKFGEFGWLVKASQLQELSDSAQKPKASPLRLYEDGKMLTLSHCPHDAISRLGSGRYSHWGDTIYFSATDNSNPNSNGRRYDVQH
jgi:SAM-dependent methyltransferase